MKQYLAIVKGQTRPVKFLLSRALMGLGLSKRITIQRRGYRLRFYPTPRIAEIWMGEDGDRVEESFIRAYLRPGDAFVDVGANVGEIALLSSGIVGNQGRVFAVEAHPRIFRYLKGNIALNGASNIAAFNTALGDREGTVRFSDEKWDEMNAIVAGGGTARSISVPCARLDSLPIDATRIDLLKIDVEGAEKFVLEGGRATLAKSSCVYFESNEEHFRRNGYSCADLFAAFREYGFRLCRTLPDGVLLDVPAGYSSRTNENLVASRDLESLTKRTGYALRPL